MRRLHGPRRLALAIVAVGLLCLLTPKGLSGQGTPIVYVAPIEGLIDLGLAPFVRRVLDEAEKTGAAAVVLKINTFGGRVDAAVLIRDTVLGAKVKTVAFIDRRAISAGALISLACHVIAMGDGGTIGAATPVQLGGQSGGTQPTDEKTISYVRKEFRSTAEFRKRPPLIAEAMVDPDVAIPGLVEKGKLLTLTTNEALEHKVADFRADTVEQVLERLGLGSAEVRRVSENWAEQLVRFLTHPIMSSLLMTVGMLGILVELRTPGFGVPGALGITSLALFFWGHWLVRLAGWEEILLVGIGLLLLAVEIFVTPGFGLTGTLGIVALIAGLTLSLVGAGATAAIVIGAAAQVAVSLLIALVASVVLLRFLPKIPFGRQLILQTGLGADTGYASAPEGDRQWLGKQGTAVSPLRPAGIAHIDGKRVDVVSQGEWIDAGAPIDVIRVDGNRIVVRRRQSAERNEP
jgi:membrane-bound serine protease (ClpP class)